MATAIIRILLLLLIVIPSNLPCSIAQTWIKAGYWFSGTKYPIADINSALFTHLICAFGYVNDSTYELNISSSDQISFSAFSSTVKQKNPSVVTVLSIGGNNANYSTYASMVSQSSYRNSFIASSIRVARIYGFEGLDFSLNFSASKAADMTNMGELFYEWRAAIDSESRNSSSSKLILTMAAPYSQYVTEGPLPFESISKNLDWVHVMAINFYMPKSNPNHTGSSAPLYDPASDQNINFGVNSWILAGLPATQIVLGLPFYGYAWTLSDPKDNAIGASANGSAVTPEGYMPYKDIKHYIQQNNAVSSYNSTYVMKYCSDGSTWIGYDDAEVVKAKVSYAKQRNLRGYVAWEVPYDDNWELSQTAAEQSDKNQNKSKQHILLKTLLPIACVTIILLGGLAVWHIKRQRPTAQEPKAENEMDHSPLTSMQAIDHNDSHYPQMFSFNEIKAATNDFSSENKLGEGGYGPVYKAKLIDGREVAVKRLSATSKQGIEEFKTEVKLTAKLQHVCFVRVLGFCIEREEKMLIYEYMPNRSLDFYIYDPINRLSLNWEQRVQIIEGLTQGLLYLQEYSRLTVIHRDLKASNILLDNQMKPKISDFGTARIFQKDKFEANTDRVVGTYGYVPPEYARQGIYSTKSDVFSFGVLLLQIISGRKNTCFYGPLSNLNLLDYAHELWTNGKGEEFRDESLDDTTSSCKLMRCLQIALQCVQEDPNDRPTMLEISYMLRNEFRTIKHPKRPAFSTKRDEDGEKSSISSKGTGQVDTATITILVPR